jgi:hypothetical protein
MVSLPNPWLVPVVTVSVAGQLLGMSERTARRAAECGELPTIRLAGRRHVPVAKLYDMLGLAVPDRPVNTRPIIDR